MNDEKRALDDDELFQDILLCPASSKAVYAKAALGSAETYINGTEPPVLKTDFRTIPRVKR